MGGAGRAGQRVKAEVRPASSLIRCPLLVSGVEEGEYTPLMLVHFMTLLLTFLHAIIRSLYRKVGHGARFYVADYYHFSGRPYSTSLGSVRLRLPPGCIRR